jgi:hypothetical protein
MAEGFRQRQRASSGTASALGCVIERFNREQ